MYNLRYKLSKERIRLHKKQMLQVLRNKENIYRLLNDDLSLIQHLSSDVAVCFVHLALPSS